MSTLRDNWPVLVGMVLVLVAGSLLFEGPAARAAQWTALGALAAKIGLSFARLRLWPATARVIDWQKLDELVRDGGAGDGGNGS
jgi:hypothetical protein